MTDSGRVGQIAERAFAKVNLTLEIESEQQAAKPASVRLFSLPVNDELEWMQIQKMVDSHLLPLRHLQMICQILKVMIQLHWQKIVRYLLDW